MNRGRAYQPARLFIHALAATRLQDWLGGVALFVLLMAALWAPELIAMIGGVE